MRIDSKLAAVLLAALPVSALASPGCIQEGWALYRSGRLTRAAELFGSPACLRSRGALAYLDAAVVRRDLGQDREALALFAEAAKRLPVDADAHAEFGNAALRAGDLERAASALDAALALEPAHPWALVGFGRLMTRRGRFGEAERALERLTGERPDLSVAWLALAEVYERSASHEKAIAAYRNAFKADWTLYEARLSLARLYRRLGDYYEAWLQYAKVRLLVPGHAEARRNAAELGKRLGRSEGELLAVKAAFRPKAPSLSERRERMPRLRVGIGTDSAGRPLLRAALGLRAEGPVRVLDPETGKLLATAREGERLLARSAGKGWFELSDGRGKRLVRFRKVVALEPARPEREALVLEELRLAYATTWSSVSDRRFAGTVELRARRGRLYAVNRLPVEDYLQGVVTQEMPRGFPPEALKAQAVIARGNALFWSGHSGRHRAYGYDVCDGQHCQVYAGLAGETEEGREAVAATRGSVLRHKGRLAHTIFSSNCGGHGQDSGELDGWYPVPYLSGRLDAEPSLAGPRSPWELDRWLKGRPPVYCGVGEGAAASQFRWTRVVSVPELARRLDPRGRAGPLQRVVVVTRSRSGNANEVRVEGKRGTITIKREHKIRASLGLASLRSTLFVVETERDPAGRPAAFVFYGGGWGHGVGLCQHGAAGRARRGQDYQAILSHYYPGTALSGLDY